MLPSQRKFIFSDFLNKSNDLLRLPSGLITFNQLQSFMDFFRAHPEIKAIKVVTHDDLERVLRFMCLSDDVKSFERMKILISPDLILKDSLFRCANQHSARLIMQSLIAMGYPGPIAKREIYHSYLLKELKILLREMAVFASQQIWDTFDLHDPLRIKLCEVIIRYIISHDLKEHTQALTQLARIPALKSEATKQYLSLITAVVNHGKPNIFYNTASLSSVKPFIIALLLGGVDIDTRFNSDKTAGHSSYFAWPEDTALTFAVRNDSSLLIYFLLQNKANPNVTSHPGADYSWDHPNTPLMMALSKFDLDLVGMLIKAGANPNTVTSGSGYTLGDKDEIFSSVEHVSAMHLLLNSMYVPIVHKASEDFASIAILVLIEAGFCIPLTDITTYGRLRGCNAYTLEGFTLLWNLAQQGCQQEKSKSRYPQLFDRTGKVESGGASLYLCRK